MENRIKTGIRWILYSVAFIVIAFAVLIILLRYSTPILNHKKDFFVKWGEQMLQVPVSIQSVHAQWRGFYPEISFENVKVGGKKSDQINLHIRSLSVSIDIWHSLLKMKLLPSQLDIDGAKIAIYQNKAQKNKANQATPEIDLVTWQELEGISYWLLSQADVNISRVGIYWHSQTGDVLPLHHVDLQIVNEPWRHSITGSFEITNAKPTFVKFIINNISTPFSFSNLGAKAYLKVSNADVSQWLKFIPFSFRSVSVRKGIVDGEFWVDWEKGLIQKIQSILTIHELNLNYLEKQHVKLSDFKGNFAWQPAGAGWKFSADRLKGSINNHPWQETRISLSKSEKYYALSVDYLRMQDLDIFLALDILPNKVSDIVTALRPSGEIRDLILEAALPMTNLSNLKVFAKLSHLSANPYGAYPGFSGLNGSVSLGQHHGDLHFDSVKLRFSKEWPPLENLEGELSWRGEQISLDHIKASMLDNPLDISMAKIDDLSKPVLVIQGGSKTDFSKALPVIFHSPLAVKRDLTAFSMSGPLQLDLKLTIPFSKAKNKVEGRVQFQNSALLFSMPWLNVSNLKGEFSFINKIFSSKIIEGTFLEQPISIVLSTLKQKQKQKQKSDNLLFSVNGKLNFAALKKHFTTPILSDFSGLSDFSTNILVQGYGKDSQISATTVSNMQGIQISNIPEPFSKQTLDQGLLKVVASYRAKSSILIHVDYASLLSAALKLNQQNFSFLNGEIHLGPGVANFQELPKLLITGNLARLSWPEWQAYFDSHSSQNGDQGILKNIREIELRVAQLDVLSNRWPNVYLNVTPGEQSLSLHVQSEAATGEVDIPFDKKKPWWINFENLTWPTQKNTGESTLDPRSIPSLNARIKRLQYGRKALGDVQLITSQHPSGITINKLSSHLANADLYLQGFWFRAGLQDHTSFEGYLNCVDLGNVLDRWNYPKTLEGGKGLIQFGFNWRASPLHFSPNILNGHVKINLKNGSVLKISKSAQSNLSLVRLINILSISALPDLFSKSSKEGGLPFSVMQGDFTFLNGVANTENFYMNGRAAQVWLKGKMDFAKERYDLSVRVAPYVTSSLPIIAGVAGGPIAGGVAWIAEKLVGPTIGKAIGKTYKVRGTWQKPIISKVVK